MNVTAPDLVRFKSEGHRFVLLTAYDFPTAQIFDEAGAHVLLVGDTLSIFALGHPTTLPVTMDQMIHHCQAVARGARQALVVGDLPFGTYQVSIDEAVHNAARFFKEGGARAVKLEGPLFEHIEAFTNCGMPTFGHLGLTPQSVHAFGGNKVQARTEERVKRLVADAKCLEEAGAVAVVLEAVPSEAGRRVTEALGIPTIGVGGGPHCDAHGMIASDLLALSGGPYPKFAKSYVDAREQLLRAARSFIEEVEAGAYPDAAHSYDWSIA